MVKRLIISGKKFPAVCGMVGDNVEKFKALVGAGISFNRKRRGGSAGFHRALLAVKLERAMP
jgi:hypothetical protein